MEAVYGKLYYDDGNQLPCGEKHPDNGSVPHTVQAGAQGSSLQGTEYGIEFLCNP